ncbi:MAG TPA: hypothetical protein VMG55_14590 [Stellaceae bacterium]|nr:hypothetical protein [Stellaceae bacterium]
MTLSSSDANKTPYLLTLQGFLRYTGPALALALGAAVFLGTLLMTASS